MSIDHVLHFACTWLIDSDSDSFSGYGVLSDPSSSFHQLMDPFSAVCKVIRCFSRWTLDFDFTSAVPVMWRYTLLESISKEVCLLS